MSQLQAAVSRPVHEVELERHVKIPMRDGILLDSTIWRPKQPGRCPVIVERVGYELLCRCCANAEFFARRGYVFVGQNVRGLYSSDGEFSFLADDAWGERQDSYDTVEWLGTQPWSTGKVGMVDGSYSGATQYLVAPTRPPHLAALFPRQACDWSWGVVYRGGAFWLLLQGAMTRHMLEDHLGPAVAPVGMEQARARLEKAVAEQAYWPQHLPLKDYRPLRGVPAGQINFDWLDHPDDGPFWWPLDLSRRYCDVDVPIFHLAGWFDLYLGRQIQLHRGIQAQGRSPRCRRSQRLLIGPWEHGEEYVPQGRAGELDFGPDAGLDLAALRLPLFDHWLKGVENGVLDGPPVRAFLMGENRWLDLDSWPPEEVTYTPLYLRSGTGPSESSLNGGVATFEAPASGEQPEIYRYDPEDPVPSLVGYPGHSPHDYRALEGRMLTYTTAPLEKNLVVVGPVEAVLHATSSAPDTDFVVRLCDVYPDGRSISVCDGILRARYRDSAQRPELMVARQVYRFEVDLWGTAESFLAGHRLRVEVTSSDFPRYDRNLNTGGVFGEEEHGEVAEKAVLHDCARPSYLLLPILTPSDALQGVAV